MDYEIITSPCEIYMAPMGTPWPAIDVKTPSSKWTRLSRIDQGCDQSMTGGSGFSRLRIDLSSDFASWRVVDVPRRRAEVTEWVTRYLHHHGPTRPGDLYGAYARHWQKESWMEAGINPRDLTIELGFYRDDGMVALPSDHPLYRHVPRRVRRF